MIYNEKDNIELTSLYNDLVTAKTVYKDTVNKICNQADELLEKYYIDKFFYRKDSDGQQTIYKVNKMVTSFPNCITIFGPMLHVWENGNVDYRTKDVIEIDITPNNDYEDKEISEQEYNDLLTKYGFIDIA